MNEDDCLVVLREMRDLLRLIAEPAIEQRDKKAREEVRSIAGNPRGKKAQAILLMDGSRMQADIVKESGIHKGELSSLVKRLNLASLLDSDVKRPKILIPLGHRFFDQVEEAG